MGKFTDEQKRNEAAREVAMRLRHYPRMIGNGLLTPEVAQKQTEIMQEIAQDYHDRIQPTLPLTTH